ncbi:DinB family protein [uncultured Paraglaciecola sp.]|uniref:DinB family protein n=1 Tax=uncultured Paraglaciecola sp. TaxID=1765024 RepID=UPI002636CF64|nr:DinB family protein [uncultured Paraglaciecola sp.]
MEKLNQIPWEVVNEKTYGSKTIAVLVQHIINWRIFVLKKLEGDLEFNIVIDGENDWDEIHIATQEEWNLLKQRLQSTQDSLMHKISEETDELLQRQVPGKEYTFGPILTSIAQHDIYHLGQIAMLNAMHKS